MTAPATPVAAEIEAKVAVIRDVLARHRLAGVRLRGQDWFAWATGGGSSTVVLASEPGVAEILVTAGGAWVMTDSIEAARLRAEEMPADVGLELVEFPWAGADEREGFVRSTLDGGPPASDRPAEGETRLPEELVAARRRLLPVEIDRYRSLARDAAEAMTETLTAARPEATELEVAGAGAAALLRRGIDPAVVLVGGSRRVELYRHPRPTAEPIGERVMVVFCGRRAGLYANLTRFAYFRRPTSAERSAARVVALVEAAAWEASRPGTSLGEVYRAMADTYARLGFRGAEREHHQGGITGYATREVLATQGSEATIGPDTALAWNPSLAGSKIEDTVLTTADGIELLTVDPAWPTVEVAGRPRPDLLVVG